MNETEILEKLNDRQREAVLATDGPVLILAGAGSGKTRVLVHRIAYLIDVVGVYPSQILAITFTNKAADEMRGRVDMLIGEGAEHVWVSTFHSLCVRILRRHADRIGFTRSFSIYDSDDQLTLMKSVFREEHVDAKRLKEKAVLAAISSAKDELVSPEKYRAVNRDFFGSQVADLYERYQRRLKESNAMDFDDLIVKTVELFEQFPEVLESYRNRFRYLMVDEYQDTNTAQFRFVSLLAGGHGNLCVVGDDDQSIYKFRGANIRNILGFEKIYPDAAVIRLEQNYRSTKHILSAANEVIRHNLGRKEKRLWTDHPEGEKIAVRRFDSSFEEAEYVCGEIASYIRDGLYDYRDCAILYRTNAQSRLFEEKFLMANIPYQIVGGVSFYSRKEIKDLLAYLKTIDNAVDDLAVRRIINVPKRGIGATTVAKLDDYAVSGGMSLFEAVCACGNVPTISGAAAKKVAAFSDFIGVLRAKAEDASVPDVLKEVIEQTGYVRELEAEHTEEADARIDNINELVNKAAQYQEEAETPTLSGFLEEVALVADIDTVDEGDDRVLLMTLHSAKGLEFPVVFMTGMEEGLFPSSLAIHADRPEEEIEEERRLAYVGITRAKERLTLTCARERMVRGEMVTSPLSRFIREIPRDIVDMGPAGAPGRRVTLPARGADAAIRSAVLASPSFGRPFPGTGERHRDSSYSNPYAAYQKAVRSAGGPAAGSDGGAASGPAGGSAASGLNKSGSEAAVPAGDGPLGYQTGDTVRHVKFGEGVVREIADGKRDYLVTVDFPSWGVKKMYASFANLKKV